MSYYHNHHYPRPNYPNQKFHEMDFNHDGVVTRGEAAEYLLEQNRRYGTDYNSHDLNRFFHNSDYNRDGYVNYGEYAHASRNPFF